MSKVGTETLLEALWNCTVRDLLPETILTRDKALKIYSKRCQLTGYVFIIMIIGTAKFSRSLANYEWFRQTYQTRMRFYI